MVETEIQTGGEMPQITVDNYVPLIRFFLGKLTVDQWGLLERGSPDQATQILLADMMMQIVSAVSTSVIQCIQEECKKVSQKQVHARLGNTLATSFAQALDVQDPSQFHCKRLTIVFAKEVTRWVNFSLSEVKKYCCLTGPARLNSMVTHVVALLASVAVRMGRVCAFRARRTRSGFLKEAAHNDHQMHQNAPNAAEKRRQEARDIIKQKLVDFTAPFLAQSDADCDLPSPSSQEYDTVADEILQAILESMKQEGSSGTETHKVNGFFKKCVFRQAIYRLVDWLKIQFQCGSKTCSIESQQDTPEMQELHTTIDNLLAKEDGQEEEGKDKKVSTFHRVLLSDIIYKSFFRMITIDQSIPSAVVKAHILHSHIERGVFIALAIAKWWQKTQADSHTDRVIQTIQIELESEVAKLGVTTTEGEEKEEDLLALTLVVAGLISRAFQKAKVKWYAETPEAIIERITARIWDKIQGTGSEAGLGQRSLKDIPWLIYEDLLEKLGSDWMVLYSLLSSKEEDEKLILSAFTEGLMSPKKKPGATCRFFTALGRAITRPLRRN